MVLNAGDHTSKFVDKHWQKFVHCSLARALLTREVAKIGTAEAPKRRRNQKFRELNAELCVLIIAFHAAIPKEN